MALQGPNGQPATGPAVDKFKKQEAHLAVVNPAPTQPFTPTLTPSGSQPVDPLSAQREILRAANLGPDQWGAEQHHLGITPLSPTQMFLQGIGYTGNVEGANPLVDAVHQKLTEVLGHEPTFGLVADFVKAPAAQDQAALGRLLTGQLGNQPQLPQTIGHVPIGSGEILSADARKQQDLKWALQTAAWASWTAASKGKKNGDVFTPSLLLSIRQDTVQQALDAAGGKNPAGATAMIGVLPYTVTQAAAVSQSQHYLDSIGLPMDTLNGSYDDNVRRIEAAAGGAQDQNKFAAPMTRALIPQQVKQAISTLDITRNTQLALIKQYGLKDVSATGVWSGGWDSVLKDLSSSQSYKMSNALIATQDAGFGDGKFDVFNAVDIKTGGFANNADGRTAKAEFQKWQESMKGKNAWLESHTFGQAMWGAMPLGMFDKSGLSVKSSLEYLVGGADHSWNPFTLGWRDGIAPTSIIKNIARNFAEDNLRLIGVGGNVEQTLVRAGGLGFDGINGLYQQSKVDAFAAAALIPGAEIPIPGSSKWGYGDMSMAHRWKLAGQRLSDTNATWLNIALNNPDAQGELAGGLESAGLNKDSANLWAGIADQASNAAIDILVTKKFDPFELAKFAGAQAMTRAGTTEERVLVSMRNPASVERLNSTYDLINEGKQWKVPNLLDGSPVGMENFHERSMLQLPDGTWTRVDPLEFVGKGGNYLDAPVNVRVNEDGSVAVMEHGGEVPPKYHVAPASARESILKNGLNHELGTGEGVGNVHPGNYSWDSLSAAREHVGNYGDASNPLDIWEVHGDHGWEPKPGDAESMSIRGGGESHVTQNPISNPHLRLVERGGEAVDPWAEAAKSYAPIQERYAGEIQAQAAAQEERIAHELPVHGPEEEPELKTIYEAVKSGMSREEYANWWHNQVAKGNILNALHSPTIPLRASTMFDPAAGLADRLARPSTMVPRPIRFVRGNLGKTVGGIFDIAENSHLSSRLPGGTMLQDFARELQVQFTRAANPNALDIEGYDPRNVFRAARKLGAKDEYAQNLEWRFGKAVAEKDSAMINHIEDELKNLARAQGRNVDEVHSGIGQLFSGFVDRSGEHNLYDHPDSMFGEDGHLHNRQWAAISAAVDGASPEENALQHTALRNELKQRGFNPFESVGQYGGTPEKSFFVPGMTPREANELGKKFNQESVLLSQGLLHTTGDEAGNLYKLNDVKRLRADRKDDFTQMKIHNGHTVKWTAGFESNPTKAVDAEGNLTLPSKQYGEVKPLTPLQQIDFMLRRTDISEQERADLEEMRTHAKDTSQPIIPEEMLTHFSIPYLRQPREEGIVGMLNGINEKLLNVSRYNRHALLALDPMLFFKHGVADTARRLIGEGGFAKVAENVAARGELDSFLSENPKLRGLFDSGYEKAKMGELRYNVGNKAHGESNVNGFWTGGASDQAIGQAAAYMDRHLMSGAYQAWKTGGRAAVRKFFLEDPAGIRLATEEGNTPSLLAEAVGRNLDDIHNADPTALDFLEGVRNAHKGGGVRKALAQAIKDNKLDLPVTGNVEANELSRFNWRKLDELSTALVGKYMTLNKWNRGGMFHDMTARYFKYFREIDGNDQEALRNAIALGHKTTQYHMLDLAHALQVEQTFRWADYFLTKHRLYWGWVISTMGRNPELAVAVKDFQQAVNLTNGSLNFDLPVNIPGVQSAGGKTSYTIPLARLLWLDPTSSTMPGTFSTVAAAVGKGQWENAVPFTKNASTDLTPADSALKFGYMRLMNQIGEGYTSSHAVEGNLSTQQAYKFKLAYWRIYASGEVDGHWKNMSGAEIDAHVTQAALTHMTVTGMWRQSGFTGGYINDPKLTGPQEKIWKQYNETVDPGQRQAMRLQNPWINGQIGLYNTTSQQHVKSQAMWTAYQQVITQHEALQDTLLAKFRATGDAKYLFGAPWKASGALYQQRIEKLKAEAKAIGAKDFYSAMSSDGMVDLHAQYAAELHRLYPYMTPQQINAEAGKAKTPPWVAHYQAALKGDLSEAAIKKLPDAYQSVEYQLASYYKSRLIEYESDPAGENAAQKIRDKYFSNVYAPYKDEINKAYTGIAQNPGDTSVQYDKLRAWEDAQDHPVMVNGVKLPSAQRMAWIMLPPDARAAKRQKLVQQNWGWLTAFQKSVLGVDVKPDTQKGWDLYLKEYDGNKLQYSKQNPGKSLYIDDATKLQLAKWVDQRHPGFLADFARSQQPVWVRMQSHPAIFGGDAKSQATWKKFMGNIQQMAEYLYGTKYKSVNGNVANMMTWNAGFRKKEFSDMFNNGLANYDHGIPLGAPASPSYPTGGWYYRWAKAQHSNKFFQEFQAQIDQNPQFITDLFGPGA